MLILFPNNPISDNQSQGVYRTRTENKYHRSECSYLKSKIETTVSESQYMGLGSCSLTNRMNRLFKD